MVWKKILWQKKKKDHSFPLDGNTQYEPRIVLHAMAEIRGRWKMWSKAQKSVILYNLGSRNKLSCTLHLIVIDPKQLTGPSAERDCGKLSCFSEAVCK